MPDEGAARPRAGRWLRLASLAALGFAWSVLLFRFVYSGASSLTYNEAMYAELAMHPWWSSFYPDQVFVRHPPLWLATAAVAGIVARNPVGAGLGPAGQGVPWTRTGTLAALFHDGYEIFSRADGAYLLWQGGSECDRVEPVLE